MRGKPDFKNIQIGEVRKAGCTSLFVACPACGHNRSVPMLAFDRFADEVRLGEIGRVMRCEKCNRKGNHGVYPDSRSWIWHLRRTGQDHRLPYWAPMVPEEGELSPAEIRERRG